MEKDRLPHPENRSSETFGQLTAAVLHGTNLDGADLTDACLDHAMTDSAGLGDAEPAQPVHVTA